jgi:hypothetical protein
MAKTDAPAVTIGAVTPPPRQRERKITLPNDVLDALAAALSATTWTGNGVQYGGEDGNKDATNAARIYRRDLSRHANIAERDIRTRVWDAGDGNWMFALKRRSESNGAS